MRQRYKATIEMLVDVWFTDDGDMDLQSQAIDAVTDTFGSFLAEVADMRVVGPVVPGTGEAK